MSLLKRQKRASGTHQGHQSDKTKWNPTVATPHGESSLAVSSFSFLYSLPLFLESSSRTTRSLSFLFTSSPRFLLFTFSFSLFTYRRGTSYPFQCEWAKKAEKARIRPGRTRERPGLEPFKGRGGRYAKAPSLSQFQRAVVSKAPLIFFCDGMQSRVINRMFVFLTVEKRASPSYYNVGKQQERVLKPRYFQENLKSGRSIIIFSRSNINISYKSLLLRRYCYCDNVKLLSRKCTIEWTIELIPLS